MSLQLHNCPLISFAWCIYPHFSCCFLALGKSSNNDITLNDCFYKIGQYITMAKSNEGWTIVIILGMHSAGMELWVIRLLSEEMSQRFCDNWCEVKRSLNKIPPPKEPICLSFGEQPKTYAQSLRFQVHLLHGKLMFWYSCSTECCFFQ